MMAGRRVWRDESGQHLLEWVLLFMAVVVAAKVMSAYVHNALAANVKTTEMQLNGAMHDNQP